MDLKAELDQLRERAITLEETIKDMDHQIERAMHSAASQTQDVGRALSMLSERHNAQLGLMFDLGKVTARIEDLENRLREQDERPREEMVAEGWNDRVSPEEDRLDWLHSPLPERGADHIERHPHHEAQQRMLDEVQREGPEPEDYLDWWKR
ncbi:hypothetical protein [Agrobacterium cavarae]